jgi:hypothetical protein
VIYRTTITNRSYVPKQADSTNADERKLGLAFSSLSFQE